MTGNKCFVPELSLTKSYAYLLEFFLSGTFAIIKEISESSSNWIYLRTKKYVLVSSVILVFANVN